MAHPDEAFVKVTAPGGQEYLVVEALDASFPVKTFFTTRNGGVSTGPYRSQNMGFATDDDADDVKENRRRFFEHIGGAGYIAAVPVQVHGSEIVQVRTYDADVLRDVHELVFPHTDALVTDEKNVILTSLHADCIPVWLYDPVHHAAGIAHAGWRGTRADIAAATARRMGELYGSAPEDMVAVIGPGIGYECFEVGREVVEEFTDMIGELGALAHDDGNGKAHLDLKGINQRLLERIGVEKIMVSGLCTVCEPEIFYSYRRDGAATGRMCAGICLL